MSAHIYIGIDNGVSGSIAAIVDDLLVYIHTPVKKALSYTKVKKFITRIDAPELQEWFKEFKSVYGNDVVWHIALERPFVNPKMFLATLSAIRALEATICVLETLKLPYQYLDSKQWQRDMLPSGLKGKDELKKASLCIGRRLFPQIDLKGFNDCDGLLMAEWLRGTSK